MSSCDIVNETDFLLDEDWEEIAAEARERAKHPARTPEEIASFWKDLLGDDDW